MRKQKGKEDLHRCDEAILDSPVNVARTLLNPIWTRDEQGAAVPTKSRPQEYCVYLLVSVE